MRNLATYTFILLLLSNCSSDNNKIKKAATKINENADIEVTIKFNKQKEQDVLINYVDGFNDLRSFEISRNDSTMHKLKIATNYPIFVMDWTENQTYYVLYPEEKLTIEPSTKMRQFLTINSSKNDHLRKNELVFFQALGLSEKKAVSAQLGKILGGHGRSTGRDMSAVLAIIELAKYKKSKNTAEAYQFIKRKYDRKMDFLKRYKIEHPISNQFYKIVSKLFQFEFESSAFEILKNAIINHNEVAKEFSEISAQEMNTDTSNWLFLPSYQYKLKNYLSYSYLKRNLTNTKARIDFINKEFKGATRDFCKFLVFKGQETVFTSSEMAEVKSAFRKSGQQYFDYIKKNQEFYSSAGKNLDSNSTQLQSFTGVKISFENLVRSFKGKVIVLDFWASWCSPCKQQIPFSKRLHDELKNENVEFVYLSLDKSYNDWYRDAKLLGLEQNSFLVNSAFNAKLSKNLRINSIPRYVLINKKGEMVDLDSPRPSDPALRKKLRGY